MAMRNIIYDRRTTIYDNIGIAHGLTVYVGLAQARPNDMDCEQPYHLCGARSGSPQ